MTKLILKILFLVITIGLTSVKVVGQSPKEKPHFESEQKEAADKLVNDIMGFDKVSGYLGHLIGRQLPQLKGTTVKGLHFNSSEFLGKPMVLNFWFIQCPVCYKEVPDLNRVYEDSKKEDFVFMSFCKNESAELTELFETTEGNGYKRKRATRKDEIMYYDIVPGASEFVDLLDITGFPVTLAVGKDGKITNVILYISMAQYPDEMITYRLVKAEVESIRKN